MDFKLMESEIFKEFDEGRSEKDSTLISELRYNEISSEIIMFIENKYVSNNYIPRWINVYELAETIMMHNYVIKEVK